MANNDRLFLHYAFGYHSPIRTDTGEINAGGKTGSVNHGRMVIHFHGNQQFTVNIIHFHTLNADFRILDSELSGGRVRINGRLAQLIVFNTHSGGNTYELTTRVSGSASDWGSVH